MKRLKRLTTVILTAIFVVTLAGCAAPNAAQQQANFDTFMENEFISEVETSGYLQMHQLFEEPQNFGIDPQQVEVSFGDLPEDFTQAQVLAQLAMQRKRQRFSVFDRGLLTAEQQELYDIYDNILSQAEKSSQPKYAYLAGMWSTDAGLHLLLPMNLSALRISQEQDIEDILTLIEQIPEVFESYIAYTREQEKRGLMMIPFEEALEGCRKQLQSGMQNAALLDIKKKVSDLSPELSDEQIQAYHKQLDEAFEQHFLPAYEQLLRDLTSLQNGNNNPYGLSHVEHGKEYYQDVVFPGRVGNDRSVEESIELLETWMKQADREMFEVYRKSPNAIETFGNFVTSYTEYEDIVADLLEKSQEDFPEIERAAYHIEPIHQDQNVSSILAYYVKNAIDASAPDQIRVNPDIKANSVELFMTMAHEGAPGHMYQSNYVQQNKGMWSQLVRYLGYQEGYACYVGLYALQYLEDMDPNERQLFYAATLKSWLLSARLDIGIHYEGWKPEDLQKYLQRMGLNGSVAQDYYEQVQTMSPGSLLSYGVGVAEFLDLREYAQQELGNQFTNSGFHEAILKSGPAPFSVVRGHVQAYVGEVRNQTIV